MDKRVFDKKVQQAKSWPVNVGFMAEWFEWTIKRLEAEGAQSKSIQHPGKKGERCEDILRDVLRSMVPNSIGLTPGFVATRLGTVSKEQDVIFFDADRAMNLRPGGETRYLPIESCLASIEVKSELSIAGVREAILNCISAKSLYDQDKEERKKAGLEFKYCYGIFAYRSRNSLETSASQIKEATRDIPSHLRPNVVYILGKGMLLPREDSGWRLSTSQLFSGKDLRPMAEMGLPQVNRWKHVYPFLWFVSVIVDFCMEQRQERKTASYMEYWLATFALQSAVNKHAQQKKESTTS